MSVAAAPGPKLKRFTFLSRDSRYEDGDTSDLVLDSGGTVSFSQSFTYLGSLIHSDFTDKHDVENRI